jgi:hypothetical protein
MGHLNIYNDKTNHTKINNICKKLDKTSGQPGRLKIKDDNLLWVEIFTTLFTKRRIHKPDQPQWHHVDHIQQNSNEGMIGSKTSLSSSMFTILKYAQY